MPCQHDCVKHKRIWNENEAKKANQHANKRIIIYLLPFWNDSLILVQVPRWPPVGFVQGSLWFNSPFYLLLVWILNLLSLVEFFGCFEIINFQRSYACKVAVQGKCTCAKKTTFFFHFLSFFLQVESTRVKYVSYGLHQGTNNWESHQWKSVHRHDIIPYSSCLSWPTGTR